MAPLTAATIAIVSGNGGLLDHHSTLVMGAT